MNNKELYDAMAHIDEELLDLSNNESFEKNDRKDKVISMAKKFNLKKVLVPIAACFVIAVIAIGVFTLGPNKAPVATPDGGACATTVLYNNVKYLSIATEEDAEKAGVALTVTPDMFGEHVAYVELSGENADYVETAEKTDKEILQFANANENGALILKDGSSCWAIVPTK
ncbi:MAG: hypothetical protein KBT46_01495 [Ruminococcus sp.]|nr:hypothetical protein [Candidatus Copronaster equi]